jgi:hypothetical protein
MPGRYRPLAPQTTNPILPPLDQAARGKLRFPTAETGVGISVELRTLGGLPDLLSAPSLFIEPLDEDRPIDTCVVFATASFAVRSTAVDKGIKLYAREQYCSEIH